MGTVQLIVPLAFSVPVAIGQSVLVNRITVPVTLLDAVEVTVAVRIAGLLALGPFAAASTTFVA